MPRAPKTRAVGVFSLGLDRRCEPGGERCDRDAHDSHRDQPRPEGGPEYRVRACQRVDRPEPDRVPAEEAARRLRFRPRADDGRAEQAAVRLRADKHAGFRRAAAQDLANEHPERRPHHALTDRGDRDHDEDDAECPVLADRAQAGEPVVPERATCPGGRLRVTRGEWLRAARGGDRGDHRTGHDERGRVDRSGPVVAHPAGNDAAGCRAGQLVDGDWQGDVPAAQQGEHPLPSSRRARRLRKTPEATS